MYITGAPFSINKNLGISSKNGNGFLYTNASGPVPAEFDLTKYNTLVGNLNATLEDVNKALAEVIASQTEYNRQGFYHAGRGDKPNSDIAFAWRDTTSKVRSELELKRDQLITAQQQANIPPAGRGTGNATTGGPPPATSDFGLLKIGGIAVLIGGGITGLILTIRYFRNKNKGGK